MPDAVPVCHCRFGKCRAITPCGCRGQILKILGVDVDVLSHDAKLQLLRNASGPHITVVVAARSTSVAAEFGSWNG